MCTPIILYGIYTPRKNSKFSMWQKNSKFSMQQKNSKSSMWDIFFKVFHCMLQSQDSHHPIACCMLFIACIFQSLSLHAMESRQPSSQSMHMAFIACILLQTAVIAGHHIRCMLSRHVNCVCMLLHAIYMLQDCYYGSPVW